MSTVTGIDNVKNNIAAIFERRRAALYALCAMYSEKIVQEFLYLQNSNNFWINRTGQAKDRVFAIPYFDTDTDSIGFRMFHGVIYGVYLELANDRKHEALRFMIERYFPFVMQSVNELYGKDL